MSYTDERDEIAELFGVDPKTGKGYSAELDKTARRQLPPQRKKAAEPSIEAPPQKPVVEAAVKSVELPVKNTQEVPLSATETPISSPPPKKEEAVPAQKATTKKPVKLRPPAHVEPHPLDHVHAPPPPPPEPIRTLPEIEDEDFLVYGDLEGTALDGADFINFDGDQPSPFETTKTEEIRTSKVEAMPLPESPPGEPSPVKSATPATSAKSASVLTATPNAEEPGKQISMPPARKPASGQMLLETNGLVKIYDGRTVVNGVDFNVRPGEIVGLLGPNGAGKTTSFYMIVGLVPPNGGRVMFNGDDVTRMPMYQRARLGMGYLPQEESIFRKLTVEENIMAVMETLKIPRKEKVARCNELLERFGITHIRNNIALTCSGGEKRRVTIARSLVTRPSLLMLDEPFSGVDPIAVNEIQGIVEDLRKSGLAILITDHNARQTLELVDRAYLIYEGKVLREGHRDFLINDPVSRELYLGDRFTM